MMITEVKNRRRLLVEKKFDGGEAVTTKAIDSAWDAVTKEINSVSKVGRLICGSSSSHRARMSWRGKR